MHLCSLTLTTTRYSSVLQFFDPQISPAEFTRLAFDRPMHLQTDKAFTSKANMYFFGLLSTMPLPLFQVYFSGAIVSHKYNSGSMLNIVGS
jgi:hypothetical protein